MAKITSNMCSAQTITHNGAYRFYFYGDRGKKFFSVSWESADVSPAGTLTLTFDGDAGSEPINAVINLAQGKRAVAANTRLPFIDVDVSGLPEGGRLNLYIY